MAESVAGARIAFPEPPFPVMDFSADERAPGIAVRSMASNLSSRLGAAPTSTRR